MAEDEDLATDEDRNVAIVSLCYFLYRAAGCPFGDSLSGLDAWRNINMVQPFNELSERNN